MTTTMIEDPVEFAAGSAIGGIPGGEGVPGGIPNGIPLGGGGILPPPPTRPPDPVTLPSPGPKIIHVKTSELNPARILHRVEPVYPRMAISMRVSGTVELRGIISTDGRIRELKVLSGHPLLVKAAVDAVTQWIYEPTKLNGQMVEVDAPILVTFRLN